METASPSFSFPGLGRRGHGVSGSWASRTYLPDPSEASTSLLMAQILGLDDSPCCSLSEATPALCGNQALDYFACSCHFCIHIILVARFSLSVENCLKRSFSFFNSSSSSSIHLLDPSEASTSLLMAPISGLDDSSYCSLSEATSASAWLPESHFAGPAVFCLTSSVMLGGCRDGLGGCLSQSMHLGCGPFQNALV